MRPSGNSKISAARANKGVKSGQGARGAAYGAGKPKKEEGKGGIVQRMKEIEDKRNERRLKMEEKRQKKKNIFESNAAAGNENIDVEFQMLMKESKISSSRQKPHLPSLGMNIYVCVRKRPLFPKEKKDGQIDCVSSGNPVIRVGEPKFKVDGITKFIDKHDHIFDNVFSETESTEDLYLNSVQPLLDQLFDNGVVTFFAYGQTGSGKTHTMVGVQELMVKDLYDMAANKYADLGATFSISFYEIYSNRLHDLLNNRKVLQVLEDANNRVQIKGLEEVDVSTEDELNQAIEYGNSIRTTKATQANDTSSRSHAVCQIKIRNASKKVIGKFLMVDLAGSERAQDIKSNNRDRRLEGAEINKSLLSLKECIRAIHSSQKGGKAHVPFRASKLTMVLRDSFLGSSESRNVSVGMIACVSPGYSHADHTLNTIRYAERLKTFTSEDKYEQMVKKSSGYCPTPVRKSNKKIDKPARAQWGRKKKVVEEVKQQQKSPEEVEAEEEELMMRTKKGQNDDWQYLKQTSNDDSPGTVKYEEKADSLLDMREDLIQKHMKYIRKVALLLKQEGELITRVQGIDAREEDRYPIDKYVEKMREIVRYNLKIYGDLDQDLEKFQTVLQEEEEAHNEIGD